VIRRLYHVLSVVAITHLLALGGLVGFLVFSGRLDGRRMGLIAQVLRGEIAGGVSAASQPASQPAASQPAIAEPAEAALARSAQQQERLQLLLARARRELQDQIELLRAVELDFDRKLAELQQQRQQLLALQNKLRQQRQDAGFAKMLEYFSSLQPKVAKSLLQKTKDADVVAILMALDANKGKKIIEACKTPEELEWIRRILELIRNADPQRATALGEVVGR